MVIDERIRPLERVDDHGTLSERVLELIDFNLNIADMEQLHQVAAMDDVVEDVYRLGFKADVRAGPAVQHDDGRT